MNSDKVIVALDVNNKHDGMALVDRLSPFFKWFKVGLELVITQQAEDVIKTIKNYGCNIFLDVKLNDIPTTVGRTVRAVCDGIDMINVHALAGVDAMRAAVDAAGDAKVLAVTVLSSLTGLDLDGLGFHYDERVDVMTNLKSQVRCLATLAESCGCHGVICAPSDLSVLSESKLLKVTPGVRPVWAQADDQKRVMTPHDAFAAGADYLVVGRPITRPADGTVIDAAKRLVEDIDRHQD